MALRNALRSRDELQWLEFRKSPFYNDWCSCRTLRGFTSCSCENSVFQEPGKSHPEQSDACFRADNRSGGSMALYCEVNLLDSFWTMISRPCPTLKMKSLRCSTVEKASEWDCFGKHKSVFSWRWTWSQRQGQLWWSYVIYFWHISLFIFLCVPSKGDSDEAPHEHKGQRGAWRAGNSSHFTHVPHFLSRFVTFSNKKQNLQDLKEKKSAMEKRRVHKLNMKWLVIDWNEATSK